MDTIFALSSAPGRAGVSVFRVSGKDALKSLEVICPTVDLRSRNLKLKDLQPRQTYLVDLYSPKEQLIIDKALAIFFKTPNSFTGEDVVEFHTHGSIAVGNLLIEALMNIEGFRVAEPGEFSRRAFLNGKMDLTAAEGLADLIEAETSQQIRQAMRQMNGELEELYEKWRHSLLKTQSLLEAYIDFPDEDIPTSVLAGVEMKLNSLTAAIEQHLNDDKRGERLRSGIRLAIFGPPNAGKSSLLNYLAQRDVAIISAQAGTTRDVLEIHLDVKGYPIIVADTAGMRSTEDVIELEGIKRAERAVKQADIKIFIFDSNNHFPSESQFMSLIDDDTIILANKIDSFSSAEKPRYDDQRFLPMSIKDRIGLDRLFEVIAVKAESLARPSETPALTRMRYRKHLSEALSSLKLFSFDKDLVLAAEDIRLAARSLSQITGKITVDEILGEIFTNFCIGK